MKLDMYWKQAAAGLMAVTLLLVSGNTVDSFAMAGGPQKAYGQTLSSPAKVIIKDEEAAQNAGQAGQTGGEAQTGGQAGQNGGEAQNGGQAGQTGGEAQNGEAAQTGGQAAIPAAPRIEAFGAVNTPVTDSSSLFGAGRLTMYANHDTSSQLLSVIIENGEGGLIVVDGGWTNNADFLLNQIKQKGGHVQAWLITHPDSDHAGALADILYKHSNEITIDGVYYSFLEDSWYQEKDANVASMVNYIKGSFANISQDKLHGNIVSGQVIDAGPAKIQVLNQAYKTSSDFVNNSSVAYMVSLNGTNTVFLGDLALAGGERLMSEHDLSALDCDIVQMSHHGQNGVDYEVYKALKPEICLWPTPQWLWDNDAGSGGGTGSWKTQETRNWMTRLGVKTYYCIKDGDQVIE